MQLNTTRFGSVRIRSNDIFRFPQGLIGFADCQRWVLLADAATESVGWLQSATHPELAVAVVSPRRFVPDYKFHVAPSQLVTLNLSDTDRAFVLNIVAKQGYVLTTNLKAPLIFNLDGRLGCQVVVSDDHPLQHELADSTPRLRKIA